MKLTPTILKLAAGLALLAVITLGKSPASASQGYSDFTPTASKQSGTPLVAIAVLVVGVAGCHRRKA